MVIQGENPALTLGVSGKLKSNGDASGIFDADTLSGGGVEPWIDPQTPREALYFYQAPDKQELIQKEIRAIYLQYYTREWSQVGNADFAIARGLLGRASEDLHELGRYRRYSALDSDLQIPNQMIKYLKFGFGFATDEACYDIREGRLTREDAVWLVNEYDGKCGQRYLENACRYLQISVQEFWRVVDQFVNRTLFVQDAASQTWIPQFVVGQDTAQP